MPSAFYALSFEDTGFIVSYCQLGQRDLSKAGAAAALLDQLVKEKLDLSLSLRQPLNAALPNITIQKSQLRVDEVKVPDALVATFTIQPSTFLLDLRDPKATPGDGTAKQLLDPSQPGDMLVATPKLFAATTTPAIPPQLRVSTSGTFPSQTKLYAIVDGKQLPANQVGTPQSPVPFDLPASATSGTWHTVMFTSRGYQPFLGFLQVP